MRDALVVKGMLLVAGAVVAVAGAAVPVRAEAAAQTSSALPSARANPLQALASCSGCHGLTRSVKKMPGPPLFGIYGSKPTKTSIKVEKWDDKALDKFLWNPAKTDPSTRMFFKLRDPNKRANIIAALKILK